MAAAAASSVNKDMDIAMERLSTGKRINAASDDAAGVAIASRLTSEIRGTNQAIRNAMDAQALIDTAEGAHKEIENILQRMRELAVQSANDTNDSNDRTNLQAEMDQLVQEIDRISQASTWAGQQLLDGDGTGANQASFNFHIGANTADHDSITVNINAMSSNALSLNSGSATFPTIASESGSVAGSGDFTVADATGKITFGSGSDASGGWASGDSFSVSLNGVSVSIAIADDAFTNDPAGVAQQLANAIALKSELNNISVDVTGGVVTLTQGGAVNIGATSTVSSRENALSRIDTAIKTLNTQRANLGAVSNRLDNTVSNLTNISNNLVAGRGRIEDTDFAAETTMLSKSQILQQASTAMLAQANASKQNVLSLLQG